MRASGRVEYSFRPEGDHCLASRIIAHIDRFRRGDLVDQTTVVRQWEIAFALLIHMLLEFLPRVGNTPDGSTLLGVQSVLNGVEVDRQGLHGR